MGVKIPSVETVFGEAIEIVSASERTAYLDRACGGDVALRRQVESLLGAYARAGDFLEAPDASPTVAHDPSPPAEGSGAVIGPYKLLEEIGEGGMGVVYMAEQAHPMRRRVALKVIRPGMDSRQVTARFEAERQALALMDHPNIARVHDAGTTGSGRPYFVMELVRGLPITEYCDRENLPVPERLELFVLVCRAVQHAHQKGVIHRDLKPSNVMVTVVDGVPVPKVIDFGVAKATGGGLTERTLFTGFHQLVGTPLYMSPEQADLSSADVDTRSDIYALGVLLYELLTGSTPFDAETLRKAAFDEMRRIIREEEPPKPSTRLSALGESVSTVSARRGSDPRRLDRAVRGELDWIAMKALEKDRRRRYETANDFAADVMNYLTHRPVEACPPSARYRLAKGIRRHRASVTTAALVALALVGGIAASAWQAVRANAAERRTAGALVQAKDHLGLARQAVDELYDEVASRWTNNLHFAPLPRPFLEKVLPFYKRFAEPHRGDSEVGRAHLRVGEILLQLQGPGASQSLRRAEVIFQALVAVDPENDAHRRDLADCYAALAENGDPDTIDRAIVCREWLVARHPGDPQSRMMLAKNLHFRGVGLSGRRRPDAVEQLNRARVIQERLCADEPANPDFRSAVGMTLRDIGNTHRDVEGRLKEAESFQRRALAIHDALVTRHPTRPQFWLELGWSNWELGNTLMAKRDYREVPAISNRAATIFEGLTGEYPTVTYFREVQTRALLDVARAQFEMGRPQDADAALRRMEAVDLPHVTAEFLVWIACERGLRDGSNDSDHATAMDLLRRSLRLRPDGNGLTWHAVGAVYYRSGDIDAAIRELERAASLLGDDLQFATGFWLAMAYHCKGDAQKARAWYDRNLRWVESHDRIVTGESIQKARLRLRDEASTAWAHR